MDTLKKVFSKINKYSILKLIPVLLIAISVFGISFYVSDKRFVNKTIPAKASENAEQIGEREKKLAQQEKFFNEYQPNELIIRLKPDAQHLKSKFVSKKELEMEIDDLDYDSLDETTIPSSIKTLHKKFKINKIDKVFKNAKSSKEELIGIKKMGDPNLFDINENKFIENDLSGIYKISFKNKQEVNDVIKNFKSDSSIQSYGRNYLGKVSYTPNDPLFSNQWSIIKTQTNLAWDTQKGTSRTVVAIIDTGIDLNHEDLVNSLKAPCSNGCGLRGGWDTVNIDLASYQSWGFTAYSGEDYTVPDNLPSDFFGHGTHVAGIVAATGNNSKGVIGVCPNCKIMPIRAGFAIKDPGGNEVGVMEWDDVAAGIYYAVNNGAKIISMSFGGFPDDIVLKPAIDYAKSMGVILIAAAGNSYTSDKQYSYPAAYDGVVAVTASDNNDFKAGFSNYGYWTSISAPGYEIMSTLPKSGILLSPTGYGKLSGTSMSAPFVAGVAGLIISKNPLWKAEQVRRTLLMSADIPSQDGSYFGYGRVNSKNSISYNSMTLAAVAINSPEDEILISKNQDVVGKALGKSYKLEYGKGIYPTLWTLFNNGSTVNNGLLGVFNINSFPSTLHTIKLTVNDGLGSFYVRKTIAIDTDLKSGWPVNLISSTSNQPAVADINGDGKKEIITGASYLPSFVTVFDYKGNILKQWSSGDATSITGPAVGDLDNDGSMEIVVTNMDDDPGGSLFVFSYNKGLIFQKVLEQGQQLTCPVLSDINNDGYLDIVTVSLLGKVFVLDRNGNNLPGWPQVASKYDFHGFDCPAVADIDNDGQKEIIVTRVIDAGYNSGDLWMRLNGGVTVFKASGLVSWSKEYVNDMPTIYWSRAIHASPVISDINNDGKMEIVLAQEIFNANSFDDRVYKNRYLVLDNKGNSLPGWPKETDTLGDLIKSPVIADLNNDNKLEIIGQSKNSLYVWKYDGTLFVNPTVLGADNLGEVNIEIPSVGDINGDSMPEIIVGAMKNCRYSGCDRTPKLFIVSAKTGEIINTKDLYSQSVLSVPVVTDLENDSITDLVFQNQAKIFVWDIKSQFTNVPYLWGMWQNNIGHTGFLKTNFYPSITPTPVSCSKLCTPVTGCVGLTNCVNGIQGAVCATDAYGNATKKYCTTTNCITSCPMSPSN